MIKIHAILFPLIFGPGLLLAQIKIDHDRYRRLLEEKECETLILETKDIRESEEYGKNWMIDYYLTMGLCCIGEYKLALKGFSYIEKAYPDYEKNRKIFDLSKQSCNVELPNEQVFELARLIVANWGGGTKPSVVRGKLGYVLNCNQDVELYEFNPRFNQAELQNRLFAIDEKEIAVNYYQNFLRQDKYNINASGRFIYVTPKAKSLNDNDLRMATDQLERAYQFMVNYYDVRPPDKLITVYLMENKKMLQEVALDTHGLQIPSENYGYSNLADLSILGNSSAKGGLGTIQHELFHLIIRTDLGDIPGWLDEGIACLYEEAEWDGDRLVSQKNVWRTFVLRSVNDTKNPLPLLGTIIENNWNEFTPSPTITICQLSVNYAMAKHFAMYMERKNLLQTVVDAYMNRKNIFVDTSYVNESDIVILEKALGKELPQIQTDFDLWLKEKYNIPTNRDYSKIRKRMASLYNRIGDLCSNEVLEDYHEEFQELTFQIDIVSQVQSGLYERCLDLISDLEAVALDCYPDWR